MKGFIVPSTDDMRRLNRQQRLALTHRLQDALIELGANAHTFNIAAEEAKRKSRELARVEMSKKGQHVSVEMLEAIELLEQLPVEDAQVTAARRYALAMDVR